MAVSVVDIQVNSQNAVRNLQQVNGASRAAATGVNALKAAIAPLLTAFAAIQAAKFVFVKTAELETQTRSIQTLTGSVQQAKQIISELQQIGAVTPFTSTQLIESAKRLSAFGVAANDVVDTTKRLGDVAGATGANLGELSLAYGQVIAKGRLQGEELLQFQERGVALQDELRKMYGLTGEEFSKALSKGQISAKAVEVALQRLTDTGGKYANGAIAQSDTLSGRLSTLQDGIEQTARRIGASLEPALNRILALAIQVVDSINQALAAGSVGIGQKQAFQKKAQDAVRAQAGFMPGGPFGAGQISVKYGSKTYKGDASGVVSSITNDLINAEVKSQLGQTRAAQRPRGPAAIPPLAIGSMVGGGGGGGGRAGGGGGGASSKAADDAKRLTEQMQQQLKVADDLNFTLKNRLAIAQTTEPVAKRMLEYDIRQNEIAKEYGELKQAAKGSDELILINANEIIEQRIAQIEYEREINELLVERARLMYEVTRAASMPTVYNPLREQEAALQAILEKYPAIGAAADAAATLATSGMASMIDGTKSAQEVFADFLNTIANALMQTAAKMIAQYIAIGIARMFAGMGGGGGGFAPSGALPSVGNVGTGFNFDVGAMLTPRAMGGSVTGGQPYLVGERGPELFTPGRSGGIAPAGSFGGGIVVNVSVDAKGTKVEGDQQEGAALGRVISAAVQSELIKQQRPGGLLAGAR